jgi:hypothetical protein
VNSKTQVANLNASLLGGLGASAFVQGGGRMRTGEVTLSVGQSSPLIELASGTFTAICSSGPTAELRYANGSNPNHLWVNTLTGSSTSFLEVSLNPTQSYTSSATLDTSLQYTIQDASSDALNTHVGAAQAVMVAGVSSCDFAIVANAGP